MPNTPIIEAPKRDRYAALSDAVFTRACERYQSARPAYWATGDESGTRRFLKHLFDRLADQARVEVEAEGGQEARSTVQRAQLKAALELSLQLELAVHDEGPRYLALPAKTRGAVDNLRARLGYLMAGQYSGRDKTVDIEDVKEQIATLVTDKTEAQRRAAYYHQRLPAQGAQTDALIGAMFSEREIA